MSNQPIFVTRPFLPPLEEFVPYLETIWTRRVLTNSGPFHKQLEEDLCDYLGVEHISLFNNATIALITALQSLEIKGEVITTPFSFVATSHSLLWNNLTPVFVDIDPEDLNIDPSKIESAITDKTTAIMPVHCYGHSCDCDAIEEIANRRNLKVIYDAAHAFGVQCHCGSVLKHGDLSILSFHATKVFNTFEGGAIVSHDLESKQKIDYLKNFGHEGEISVVSSGINGKMSEFNSALGLLQLKYVDGAIRERREIDSLYQSLLAGVEGIKILGSIRDDRPNYSYFPILVNDNFRISRDELYDSLKQVGIYTRRYFYPLISEFPMYKHFPSSVRENLPVAVDLSEKILCLPIYPGLEKKVIHSICNFISGV